MSRSSSWTVPPGLALALALAAPPAAVSAENTGALVGVVTDAATGAPVAGATVTATGRNLPGAQVATTGPDGAWRLDLLPPGPYRIVVRSPEHLETARDQLNLGPGRTLKVALGLAPSTVQLEDQEVPAGAPRPAIDPTSAETGLAVPGALARALPLPASVALVSPAARSFESAALAAPGADADLLGVAFAGGASSENRYYVGGFDVTDPALGVNLAPLLVEFVEEVDVKTGSYAPRYGRASGGVVSAVTRSGSNELHGTIFTHLVPRWALQPDGDFSGTDGRAFWTRDRNRRGAYDLDFGVELGGPIVRDRLWFHAGFAPVISRNVVERELRANVLPDALGDCPAGAADQGDGLCRGADGAALQEPVPDATRRWPAVARRWQYTGKLTWLVSPDQTLVLSAFGAPYGREHVAARAAAYRRVREEREGLVNFTATWTGRFLSRRLLVEALAGAMLQDRVSERNAATPFDAALVPAKAWYAPQFGPLALGLLEPVPPACDEGPARCLVAGYVTGGFRRSEYEAQRLQARLSVSLLFSALGAHAAEAGVDAERAAYRYVNVTPGGATYDMFLRPDGSVVARATGRGTVSRDPVTGEQVPAFQDRMAFEPLLDTPAVYLQDRWQPHATLTLTAGLRWESLSMYDRVRRDLFELRIEDALSPRLQVVWDPGGRGRGKLAAGWGRFHETPPLGLADTSFNRAFLARYVCPIGTPVGAEPLDPRLDCPVTPAFFDGQAYLPIDPRKPVAPGIDASYVDHLVVSAEHELWRDVAVGLDWQARRLGPVIEDLGTPDGAVFYVANPGASRPFQFDGRTLDPRTAEMVDPVTGRTVTFPVPRPERSYDGVTLRVTKLAARGLFGVAAYTWSRLRGNYAGRIAPDVEQWDAPGQTVEYDFPEFLANRRGLLPGDRTHTLRLYGGWRLTPTPRLGLALGAGVKTRSGAPVDVRGEPAPDPLGYGGSLAFVVPRGRGGRTPWTTQVDLRGELDYAFRPPWAVRLTVDAFNALDARSALSVDEAYTFDQVSAIPGAACSGNPAGRSDPAAAVALACPDLAYLRTVDGRPVTVNRNWGRATSFQEPIELRFGLAVTF